ncbi:hypothetical protein C6499_22560 [Candidatus Poribacteria bacterium]|nr:MAG: hypothetical protein C6499_22560 [Candidatus Poribacteria bacterium]
MSRFIFTFSIFLLFCVFWVSVVDAQQNIAQEAYTILEANCARCHDATGAFKDDLLLDRDALVNTGVVMPGNPLESEFYKRLLGETEKGPQMPLGLPALSDEAIRTIALWIALGAPDWDVSHSIDFIAPDTVLDTIASHLGGLDPLSRTSARYFTLTHLYNSGESPETLRDYRVALSKLVNSLSWGFVVTNPTPVDALETIFYIDLRHYEWDRTNAWAQIEAAYPYNPAFDPQTQAGRLEKMAALRAETGSFAPFVHVDWFLATASLPPLYNDILGLPQNTRELERQLDVNVAVNIRNAPGVRVWRAGFNDSGVSNHNRVVERHTARYGAYWKSYDFAGSVGSQNIFTHPLNFTHDGGEMIFNLPNGLQAYYLADAVGNRLDVAPTTIVSNPAASDPAVKNGLSCIGCHTEGMKDFTDSVRAAIEQNQNPPYNKAEALRLYPAQSVLDTLLQTDTARFESALAKIGEPFANAEERNQFFERHKNEPVQRFHEAFQAPLDVASAAAAVGLETPVFLTEIREKQSLKDLGLTPLVEENGTVKRDAWTSNFHDVRAALFNPEYVAPDREGPMRPVGDFYIPDVNLRAVIAERLGKAADEEITAAEMLNLRNINADRRGIRDLTGLEFATQLERIEFRHNMITDLSPLAGLTQLNNIKLRDNEITDVTPLAKLIRVDWLGLEQNRIIDLAPLSGLTRLQGIGISGNPVIDVSPLAKLTSLERIDAWQTPISDFSPLATLRVLRWIEYGNDKSTTALPSLTGLKALRRLEIHGCGISDISALAELTQLRWLELVNNAITDLSPLENLTDLTHLNLDANLILDVSPLSELTNLNLLYLENNVISDVSPLSELTNLHRLDVRNNAIFDFSPLDDLQGVAIRMTGNPGFPTNRGAHITGPWLWAIVPGTRLDTQTDFLSRATNGAATEIKVATNGATAGKAVGKSVWTWHRLDTGGNNINRMTDALGWGTGREIYDHIVYGAVILDAPREQQTTMFIGNDDAVKVFLNGELVHTVLHATFDQDGSFFPVTLKQGQNVLLVAIDNHGHGGFSGHFAFARDAEYEVFLPSPRFVFSTDATAFEVEDTFTLELRAENMENLGGWQADLVFNPAVLNAVEVNEGDFLQASDEETYFEAGTIENSDGKITGLKALRLSGDSVDGNGLLCSVTFTVVGAGESLLTLENFEAGSGRGNPVPSIPPELRIVVEGDETTIPTWDVNEDGITDVSDVILVVAALGQSPPENPRADVNGDGVVDGKDLAIVAAHLGEGTAGAAPFGDPQSLGLTPENVEEVLELLRAADDGSLTFRRGIANIEALYATFVPEKTALLPNYPNPFNPETWIPYHLAKPATVTLTIYGTNGTVVRTLALGHQPAGIYQTRSRAVYWDGKNDVGEPVASGIYFITLTADHFTTTRKMLLMK